MKRFLLLVLLTTAWAAPAARVLPGPLNADTRRADVPRLLGLKEEEIADGDGTECWPLDKQKRLLLSWKDERLASVTLHGDRSLWKTREGVTLGTPLSTLVRLNGQPIIVQHFEGEHAGEVLSYERGKLKGMKLTLTLHVPGYNKLTGEQKVALETPGRLRSDSPLLKALNPAVTTLQVFFRSP